MDPAGDFARDRRLPMLRGKDQMSEIGVERLRHGDGSVPASFQDAILGWNGFPGLKSGAGALGAFSTG